MSQPWADQPFPLVATPKDTEAVSPRASSHITWSSIDKFFKFSASTVRVATEMALAHNLIVRNLNAIYLQAEGVTELSDIADFLIFCQAWVDASHLHHDAEEMYFFPDIEAFTGQKNIMSGNIEQHRAFGPGLDRFAEYVSNTPAASYSGKNLIEMIDEFGPSLTQHLKEEIPSLLELDKFGGKALEKAWKDVDAKAVGNIKDKVCEPSHLIELEC